MSARGHVDVNERRLRPIYDCLDNGNNKKAIQEADKVLRKQKDFQCAKVLKALALLRMGRVPESTGMLHDVHIQHPTDDSTMQAMAICYRELQKLDLIADMYENALKQRPENEEILSALFMAYVRLSNYKKQQQTALSLHKLRPNKNPYYFWAIMSIVMQAHENEKLAKTMYLPLAERMTMKYVNEDRMEADAEVEMYLIILELMGHYEEALKVVRGPLGGKLSSEPQFQDWKSVELMLKLENWPKVNAANRKLLLEDCDHWQCYLDYFKSLFALIDQGWNPEQDNSIDDPVDHSLDQGLTFIKSQVERCEEMSHTPRGPFLARLELLKQLQQRNGADTDKLPSPSDLLKDYFRRFGDKLCCFTDLQMFLDLVEQKDRLQLIEDLFEELNLRHEDGTLAFPPDVKLLQRQLCLLQLAHYLGLHHSLSCDEQLQLVSQLLGVYSHGLTFGESLLETDLQHSDNFLLLAAHILVNLHYCTGSNKYLWQAASQLEKGSKKSPSNFQFKVLLIQLYATLGAFGPCATIYEHMEIKHVQNDALGYVISNHVNRLGHFSSASTIFSSMLKFFSSNHKDISECLIASYKYGSFSKIHEFVKFRERLENSIQHLVSRTERQTIELIVSTDSPQATDHVLAGMEIEPEVDHISWDKLKDNRDFSILVTWSPPEHALTDSLKQQSFSEEVAWLRIRSLVLRLLAVASNISTSSKGSSQCKDCHNGAHHAGAADMPTVLADLTKQLRTHLTECQTTPVHTQYPICGPFRTRLGTFLKLKLGDVLLEMLDIALYIHSYTENPTDNKDEKFESRMETGLVNTIAELVKLQTRPLVEGQVHHCSDEGEIHRRELEPDVIENLVLISEVLSHVTILAGVCHQLVKPMRTAHTKRQKKKKGTGAPLPATLSKFDKLISGLTESVKTLYDVVHSIDTDILSSELGELKLFDEELPLPQREEDLEREVTDKVRSSYQKSAAELSQLLALKIKYLSSLRS